MVGGIIPLLRAASFRFDGRLEQESATQKASTYQNLRYAMQTQTVSAGVGCRHAAVPHL
jgi:hypothetical protein